jgi:hypothetical protein
VFERYAPGGNAVTVARWILLDSDLRGDPSSIPPPDDFEVLTGSHLINSLVDGSMPERSIAVYFPSFMLPPKHTSATRSLVLVFCLGRLQVVWRARECPRNPASDALRIGVTDYSSAIST